MKEQATLFEAPAPFPTEDNGIHAYLEDKEILVLKNHGDSQWYGLMKEGGGLKVLTSTPDADAILDETRRLRIEDLKHRRTG